MNRLLSYPRPVSMRSMVEIMCHDRTDLKPEGALYIDNLKKCMVSILHEKSQTRTVDGLVKDCAQSFRCWMVFVTTIENQKTRFQTLDVFQTEWNLPSNQNRSYKSSCWRFETIMMALLYASVLFNKSVREREASSNQKGEWKNTMLTSYSILRNVCLDNIISWSLRKETELPFECTVKGCKAMMGMCLIELQHYAIHDSEKAPQISSKLCFQLHFWIYKKIAEIQNEIRCRINDGTIRDHSWEAVSNFYRYEAVAHMFHNYARHLYDLFNDRTSGFNESKNTECLKQSHYLFEISNQMIGVFEKTLSRTWNPFYRWNRTVDDSLRERLNTISGKNCAFITEIESELTSQMIQTIAEEGDNKGLLDPRKLIPEDWMSPVYYTKCKNELMDRFDRLIIGTPQELTTILYYLFY